MYKPLEMSTRNTFNAKGATSQSPADRNRFFTAAQHNHVGVLKEYLEAYDDAIAWRRPDGKTAMTLAVEYGHHMAVQMLLQHHAAVTDAQHAPLNAAAKTDRADIAGLLLHHRAPLDAKEKNGMTPLLEAVYYNRLKVMALLLKRGASLTATNDEGQMPLHLAAAREYPEAVSLLIENGAGIDMRNRDGLTPLMVAAQNGGLEAARVLIDKGADHYLKNDKGETALDIAQAHGDNDADFVKNFTALISARNRKESAIVIIPFTEGTARDVGVRKPIKLQRRRKPH
jgi:ankyrin repeat protein